MDAKATTNGHEFEEFVSRNLKAFRRSYRELLSVPLVVVVETNSRFDGDVLQAAITREVNRGGGGYLGHVSFYRDDGLKRFGVIKTMVRTKEYIVCLSELLQTRRLRFDAKLSCPQEAVTGAEIKTKAKRQLLRMQWPDADVDNPRFKSRMGKASGKVGGKNDDMATAIMMLAYYPTVDLARDAFARAIDRGAM